MKLSLSSKIIYQFNQHILIWFLERHQKKLKKVEQTKSTLHIMSVPSLHPVASMVPSGENRQNQTSSTWSVSSWMDVQGKESLKQDA